MGRITIKDIAKLMNVNPSTVSRALKDHPDISEAKKNAIKQLAAELGCQYLIRNNNDHAKAGNINHALSVTNGAFIAILFPVQNWVPVSIQHSHMVPQRKCFN